MAAPTAATLPGVAGLRRRHPAADATSPARASGVSTLNTVDARNPDDGCHRAGVERRTASPDHRDLAAGGWRPSSRSPSARRAGREAAEVAMREARRGGARALHHRLRGAGGRADEQIS